MKFKRFIVLMFLSLSVFFRLLNGCGGDDDLMPTLNDGPDILTGPHIASKGRITDIEFFEDRWVLASNPSEIV